MMKLDNNEKISIFGYLMGRREVMFNGVAFLFIQAIFDVVSLVKMLPSNFREDISLIQEVEVGGLNHAVSMLLFIISYILLDAAYYGNNRAKKIIEDDGIGRYMMGKIGILLVMLVSGLFLKVGITFLILQFI